MIGLDLAKSVFQVHCLDSAVLGLPLLFQVACLTTNHISSGYPVACKRLDDFGILRQRGFPILVGRDGVAPSPIQ